MKFRAKVLIPVVLSKALERVSITSSLIIANERLKDSRFLRNFKSQKMLIWTRVHKL
jgi:hypothetical protein